MAKKKTSVAKATTKNVGPRKAAQQVEAVNTAVVIASLEEKAKPLFRKLGRIEVVDKESYDKAGETLSALKDLAKLAKAEEDSLTGPLKLTIKNIGSHFKPFQHKVAGLESEVKAGMVKFLEEQDKAHEKAEQDFKEGKIKKLSTVVAKQLDTVVTSEHASVRRITAVEVEDVDKIPRKYMVPDLKLIKDALMEGTKVPGVKLVKKKSIAV